MSVHAHVAPLSSAAAALRSVDSGRPRPPRYPAASLRPGPRRGRDSSPPHRGTPRPRPQPASTASPSAGSGAACASAGRWKKASGSVYDGHPITSHVLSSRSYFNNIQNKGWLLNKKYLKSTISIIFSNENIFAHFFKWLSGRWEPSSRYTANTWVSSRLHH